MIVVTYKSRGIHGVNQIPFKCQAAAIKKAKELFEKGYSTVKVSEITEKIIYIPVNEAVEKVERSNWTKHRKS